MKGTRNTSVRRLPSGAYIVSSLDSRSALTGKFKSKERKEEQAMVEQAQDVFTYVEVDGDES